MHILNLFIIAVIIVSLFFKIRFAYVIALLCSLAAASFVYAQQSLTNILFTIAIFNLTPFLCRRFTFSLQARRVSLEAAKASAKSVYEQMLKEQSVIRRSNTGLNNEVSQIIELYRLTRDMSAALSVEEICTIFYRKLAEQFKFNKCRLILVKEDTGRLKIDRIFESRYGEFHLRRADAETNDQQILKQALGAQRISYMEERAQALTPLLAENKFLGVLMVEGLSVSALENFSILFNQFSLEFKKVSLYQKIEELAITDGLTGIFVRRYFLQRLQEEMERSARHGLELAFLMLDIDHFKRCNDNFGHLSGDVVLREVAAIIKANVREIDLAARFGGEEFSVLLPDTDREEATQVAERIRAGVDGHKFKAYDESIKVEVSIGVAGFPRDSARLKGLIDKADQALYRAKQEGRNRVCVYG